MFEAGIAVLAFGAGVVVAWWVRGRKDKGLTPEEILAEAKERAAEALKNVKK